MIIIAVEDGLEITKCDPVRCGYRLFGCLDQTDVSKASRSLNVDDGVAETKPLTLFKEIESRYRTNYVRSISRSQNIPSIVNRNNLILPKRKYI